MATEGGKIKVKRRTAPSKPYERNLTLFGKLRKSVKELLIPSWLSGGANPENEQLATGDACQAAQTTLPAGECNNVVSSVQLRNKAGDGHAVVVQSGEQPQRDLHGQGEGIIPTLGEVVGEHAGKVSTVNSVSVSRRGKYFTDRRDTSSTSTFGSQLHESPLPQVEPMGSHTSESYLDTVDENGETSGPHHIMTSTRVMNQSTDFSNAAAKRQRLWSPESDRQGKYFSTPVKEKPAFNSVLLASVSDSSVLTDSLHTSLFYPGKTRFGGASADRRASLNTSLPYQSSLPLRKQVRPHNARNTIQATTSATAQRILETLDRMSTPLADAKKIPVSDSANDSVLSFTPSSYRRTSFQVGRPATRPLQLPSRGPPTSQHQVLAQAVIAKNRHTSNVVDKRHNSSMVDDDDDNRTTMSIPISQECRGLASRIQASASSETGGSLGHQSDVSGKMKAKRFTQHISSVAVDSDVVEVPDLRTEFTLPISNMGPISLQPVRSQTFAAAASIPSAGTVPRQFIFSAPIDEQRQACGQTSPGLSDKSFKFTSPIKTSQTKTSAAGAEGEPKHCQEPAVGASSGMPVWTSSSSFTASVPAWGSTAPKPKMSSPDIGGTSSSFKSYNKWGGFEKPDDSCAASDTGAGFCLAPAATLKTGSVMDILGGGKSSSIVSTAVTSGTAKESAALPGGGDLMAKFKKPAGSWECGACMLVNKPEAAKCVCCDTAKPGVKPATSGSGNTTASSSSSTVPATSPSPDSSATSVRASDSGSSTSSIKPGTNHGTGVSPENSLSALFKKPAGSWECDTCLVQNTASAVRCLACDSSKPGMQTAGIVSKPAVSSSSSSAIKISPAGGFTFNVAATTTTTSGSGGFKFGNTSSSSVTSSSSSAPAPTGFVFGSTTAAKNNSELSSGSTAPNLMTGGFKFGASGPARDGGGVTSGLDAAGSGLGFATTSSSISAVQTNTSVLAEAKAKADVSSATSSQPSNGIPPTVDNQSNNSTASQAAGNPSAASQFATALATKDSNSKLSPRVSFNFTPVSSAAPGSVAPSSQQALEKSDSTAGKPASTLFQFGTSSVGPAFGTGLGLGHSLADSKPMLNGGFGAQAVKDNSGAASLDASKSFGNFTFGTKPPAPAFASFGPAPLAISSEPQVTQSGKRTVDFGESDHSSAKKSFNFGTGNNDASSNGLFAFGGSSESKTSSYAVSSAASSSTGGFMFNSTCNPPDRQPGGPAPSGGFQFSHSSSAAPAFQGFNFSCKAPHNTAKLASFETPADKGATSFNTGTSSSTNTFNFSSTTQQPSSVFQFGAKPADSPAATASLFTFGAAHTAAASTDGPGFGAAASMGAPGAFNIGTGGDPGRKIKKAIRRTKK